MRRAGIAGQLLLLVGSMFGLTLAAMLGMSYLVRVSSDASRRVATVLEERNRELYGLVDGVTGLQGVMQKLLREKDPDAMERLVAQRESLTRETRQAVEHLAGAQSEAALALLALGQAHAQVLEPLLRGEAAEAHRLYVEQANPAAERLLDEIRKLQSETARASGDEARRTQDRVNRLQAVIFCLVGAGVAALAWFGIWLRRKIVSRLTAVSATLGQASGTLRDQAGQVEAASQSLASGTCRQAASLEEISSSLTEISSLIRATSGTSERARQVSSSTRQAAEQAGEIVASLNQAMMEIRDSSGEISHINRSIDEIAFQTNILALNAAVEAARAGQAGMGFAVVADEVRRLAQRAAEAARETAQRVEKAVARSEKGLGMSQEVDGILNQVREKARGMDALVAEIASAGQEQERGIQQITGAVGQVDRVTQDAAGQSEQTAATARLLKRQADDLGQAVEGLERLIGVGVR